MRFSDEFSISRNDDDDWFDLECTEDTPLYVDPFLVFDDADPYWSGTHDQLTDFFGLAVRYVARAGGDKNSPAWRKAERMLRFPEPKEFALGLSMGHPEGSGTGRDFARRMAEALDILNSHAIDTVDYVEAFALFCDGMGVDRISDAFCNIVKAKFIDYTSQIVTRHTIPTTDVMVKHASWTKEGRWNDRRLALPKSPAVSGGLLLVPERFLKDIPRVTADGFWGWAVATEADVLRDDLNYDLEESLTKQAKTARGHAVARARPDFALRYLETLENEELLPYDVQQDPKLLVGWAEAGRQAAEGASSSVSQPKSQSDFMDWVKDLADEFRTAVEDTDLWKALWNDDLTKHRDEKIVQAIAGAMWVQQCKAADVDISKEPNMGRGPVDFKFSAGWTKRALIEVKFIASTKFFQGVEKQLPQYLKTEQISGGYYLCVGFTDQDFSTARIDKVKDTCRTLSDQKGVTMKPLFVDARHDNKPSASKIK